MSDQPPVTKKTDKDFFDVASLRAKVSQSNLPLELKDKAEGLITSLERLAGTSQYYVVLDSTHRYLEAITKFPWGKYSEDNLDLVQAAEVLEETHYGLQPIKDRILEYIAVLASQKEAEKSEERIEVLEGLKQRGAGLTPVLMFVGLPGVGKTSIVYSIARALNREFVRIPMGGMGSAVHLRGQSQAKMGAEPGQIVKSLIRVQTMNPIILLDEIDRVAEAARTDIMGVLLELLDPQQNHQFVDYYLNYPIDLSSVVFVCTGNKTAGVSNAVLDRMEVLQMPGYSDEEKIVIARDYLLPQVLQVVGLDKEDVVIGEELWPHIVRALGFDAGIRTTRRVIESIVRKCVRQRVSGVSKDFLINKENVRDYLPEMSLD